MFEWDETQVYLIKKDPLIKTILVHLSTLIELQNPQCSGGGTALCRAASYTCLQCLLSCIKEGRMMRLWLETVCCLIVAIRAKGKNFPFQKGSHTHLADGLGRKGELLIANDMKRRRRRRRGSKKWRLITV